MENLKKRRSNLALSIFPGRIKKRRQTYAFFELVQPALTDKHLVLDIRLVELLRRRSK